MKYRIAFIAYDWPGYQGGPIVNARRLLPELCKRGHEVHALILYHNGSAPSAVYLKEMGVTVHVQAWLPYTELQVSWILGKLAEILPDIFVPNISVSGWYAARWARESGIRTIAALRSDDSYHWGMVDQFVLGEKEWAVSGLICVSKYLCNKVKARNPEHTRLSVIPSGVPIPEKISEQCAGPLRLVYVGRLSQQQKRILDFIEAISLLVENLPDVMVTLIGSANDEDTLDRIYDKIHEKGLDENIVVFGPISPDKLHEELVMHHVLVLLSDYEGTPGAVMDGMACGLVPVCMNIRGGVQELVINNVTGLLVSDRGSGFVDAIVRLSGDIRLRKILAENAVKHVREHYSLGSAADRWEELFLSLLPHKESGLLLDASIQYKLPPVRSGLEREDRRKPMFPMFNKALLFTKKSLNRLKREISWVG